MHLLVELVYLYLSGLTIKEEIPGSYSLNVTQADSIVGKLHIQRVASKISTLSFRIGIPFFDYHFIGLASVPSPTCTLLQKSRRKHIRNASEKNEERIYTEKL